MLFDLDRKSRFRKRSFVLPEYVVLPGIPSRRLPSIGQNTWAISQVAATGLPWPDGATGSKIAFLMPDFLEVRLDSQGSATYGSFAQCGLAWTFRTPRATFLIANTGLQNYPNELIETMCNRPDGFVVS